MPGNRVSFCRQRDIHYGWKGTTANCELALAHCRIRIKVCQITVLIACAVNSVVHLQSHALPDYRRKITRIVEVRGVEHDRYVLQPLFANDEGQGKLLPTRACETWEEDAARRITRP